MALPRRLVRRIKTGTYVPSNIGAKARRVATERQNVSGGTPEPQPPREFGAGGRRITFSSAKSLLKTKKHYAYRDVFGYNPHNSAVNVDNADDYDKVVEALDFTNDEMDEYAARASIAWHTLTNTGSAGDMEIYLPYEFLWYH